MHKFSAKSPLDLVAFAPVALGFTPTESTVMLTFGATQFHARVDLGPDFDGVTDALLAPCLKHGVTQVVFLFFTEDSDAAMHQFASLRDAFTDTAIAMIDAIAVTGDRYTSLLTGESGDADVSNHPLLAEMVGIGRVTRKSRDDLRADIAMRDTLDTMPEAIVPSAGLVVEVIDMLASDAALTSEQIGTMLLALHNVEMRDTVLKYLALHRDDRRIAPRLAHVASRAPSEHRARALSVHAFAVYMVGDGAAAWISVDAAQELEPGNPLAGLVAQALESAMAPADAAQAIAA